MLRLTLTLLALAAHLIGCAQDKPAPLAPAPSPVATSVASPPSAPPCRTTTPTLRTDGDTPQRHQQIKAEVSQGNHEIAFIGASIIERWATVGKDNWNAQWAPRHAVDCGIGGDRTQHVLARLDDGLLDALAAPNNHIRWIVLNIGSNNTDVDPAADIAAGTLAIIQRLRDRLPSAQIVLFLLTPRGHWPNPQRDTIAALNTRLAPILAQDPTHVHVIDVGAKFLNPTGEIPPDLMPDFLHPSPAGYQIWSESLEGVIK